MKFHERFDLPIDIDTAKNRFVNRVNTLIFDLFWSRYEYNERVTRKKKVCFFMGVPYTSGASIEANDFYTVLHLVESIYKTLRSRDDLNAFEVLIGSVFSESEMDLGIKWDNGIFIKSGARLLDNALVNDVLHWLRKQSYQTVLKPYEKGLQDLVSLESKPEAGIDVIRDAYEALEALAKIIADNGKDLSGNKDMFLSKIKAPEEYKKILKEYINYANQLFRHASNPDKAKHIPTYNEVESFFYLTGIFVRYTMNSMS